MIFGSVRYAARLALKNLMSSGSRYDLSPSTPRCQRPRHLIAGERTYWAVAYAVTLGKDFAFFLVSLSASRRAVPCGIRDICRRRPSAPSSSSSSASSSSSSPSSVSPVTFGLSSGSGAARGAGPGIVGWSGRTLSFPAVLVERFAPLIFGSTWAVGKEDGGFVFGSSGFEDMVVEKHKGRARRVARRSLSVQTRCYFCQKIIP